MPGAAIKVQWMNGWVDTSSVTSTAPATGAFSRLTISQTAIIRMTDARM